MTALDQNRWRRLSPLLDEALDLPLAAVTSKARWRCTNNPPAQSTSETRKAHCRAISTETSPVRSN